MVLFEVMNDILRGYSSGSVTVNLICSPKPYTTPLFLENSSLDWHPWSCPLFGVEK